MSEKEYIAELERIADMDTGLLLAGDVAQVLGKDPNSIRIQAQVDPAKLGFPTNVVGQQVRIPKWPFLRFMGYGLRIPSDKAAHPTDRTA